MGKWFSLFLVNLAGLTLSEHTYALSAIVSGGIVGVFAAKWGLEGGDNSPLPSIAKALAVWALSSAVFFLIKVYL